MEEKIVLCAPVRIKRSFSLSRKSAALAREGLVLPTYFLIMGFNKRKKYGESGMGAPSSVCGGRLGVSYLIVKGPRKLFRVKVNEHGKGGGAWLYPPLQTAFEMCYVPTNQEIV